MKSSKLNREEILINTIWSEGKISLYSPVFEKSVLFHMLSSGKRLEHVDHSISEKLVLAVNDFLLLPLTSKALMQDLLYKHCLECCEAISYGFDVLDNETEAEANLREFGVKNKQDAFEKANLEYAKYYEDKRRKNRFVTIMFYPRWETEHGCELILKNGELLDFYGENGTYLGEFDD